MNLVNIFLLQAYNQESKIKIKKIPLEDGDFGSLGKEIESNLNNLNRKTLQSWHSSIENLEQPKKYRVIYSENTYHSRILETLQQNLKGNVDNIEDMDSIFYKNNLNYNAILYIFETKDNIEQLGYLFQLNKKALLKAKTVLSIKIGKLKIQKNAKIPTTSDNLFEIDEINSGLSLPVTKCISCFKINLEDMNKSSVEVYNAYAFDDLFLTAITQNIYAKTTLQKFDNGEWKIAKKIISAKNGSHSKEKGITVSFKEKKEKNIEQIISNSILVRKPLATYTDNKNRTICRIGASDLKRLIDELNQAIDDPDIIVNFEKENIPKIDLEKGELEVTEKSLPLFAAMLENKVIEKLLNHEISIPYYESNKTVTLDLQNKINWDQKNSAVLE